LNPEVAWVPSDGDLNALQNYDNTELVISGIYIRLFIANPGWVLRKPREFLTDLLETVLRLMGQSNPNLDALETVTTALVKLLEAQPALSDMVPATGYLSRYRGSVFNSQSYDF
jgi:DnaJ family protein C protein 13